MTSVSDFTAEFGRRLAGASIAPRTALAALLATFAVGFAARLALASVGHNYDLDSYEIVAGLVTRGESVYANTERYNYGPIWFCLLGLFKQIQWMLGLEGPEALHLVVATFLSLVDVAIATVLGWRYGLASAVVFLLSPIGLLITGFHSQFDNFAVLVGLSAWLLVADEASRARTRNVLASAALLGLSLSLKHILLLLPIWLLMWPRLGPLRVRVLYCAIAYGVFGLGFVPWLLDDASRAGILANVVNYTSKRSGFLTLMVERFWIFEFIPWERLKWFWLGSLLVVGWFVVRRWEREAFFLYLIAFTGLAPAFADQYLAIPLVACAFYLPSRLLWCYQATGALVLSFSVDSFNGLAARALIWANVKNQDVAEMIQNVTQGATAQLWLAVFLLVALFYGHSKLGPGRVPPQTPAAAGPP